VPPTRLSTKLIAQLRATRHHLDRGVIPDSNALGAKGPSSNAPPFLGRRWPYYVLAGLTRTDWLKVILRRHRARRSKH